MTSHTATTIDPTRQPDTATEDASKIASPWNADVSVPEFDVPAFWADKGFRKLPYASGLWGVWTDRYIFKPLPAFGASEELVDELVAVTGGQVYVLVSRVMSDLAEIANATDDDFLTDEDHELPVEAQQRIVANTRYKLFQRRVMTRWTEFLATAPGFKPQSFARRMIERCEVRRLAAPEEVAKAEDDPTKDHGGEIFKIKGAGAPENHYQGRRDQILRVGLAAAWGSIGDFFVQR